MTATADLSGFREMVQDIADPAELEEVIADLERELGDVRGGGNPASWRVAARAHQSGRQVAQDKLAIAKERRTALAEAQDEPDSETDEQEPVRLGGWHPDQL